MRNRYRRFAYAPFFPNGRLAAGLYVLTLLTVACVPTRWEQPEPRTAEPVRSGSQAQRRAPGNPPFYEVFGKRYYVMGTSDGYQETGVASWYGRKFHGNRTSNGEIYDMYKMTAAHKTLPLPTTVRVTNLDNHRSIIVRVNDRGPFVGSRVIDLSYAAARELGMIGTGTAMVRIESLGSLAPAAGTRPVVARPSTVAPPPQPVSTEVNVFLQVGAFGDPANAMKLKEKLQNSGFPKVVVRFDSAATPPIYRVRLGPISGVDEYDSLVARMGGLDISDSHLVTEDAQGNADWASAQGG